MIAELRKARVLPILIWLFVFPLWFLGLAVWQRHDQNRAALAGVQVIDPRPARVVWSLTPRTVHGYRMKSVRIACVASADTRRIVYVRKPRPSEGGLFTRWSARAVEVAGASEWSADYRGRC